MEHDDVEVWSFAVPDKPKRFRFNGEEKYEAPPVLPPKTLRAMASMRSQLAATDHADLASRVDQFRDLFAQILVPESRKRFIERFDSDDDPIDIQRQLIPCLGWLMEAYGLRPTQPSSGSSTGGANTVTTSTDGASVEASNPSLFPLTGGSTSPTIES